MIEHPEQLGFRLGLKIRIGQPASITQVISDASTVKDVVYVALLSENAKPLEKRDALKVGQTKWTLMNRWNSLARIFHSNSLRANEKEDRRRWLEIADGKDVLVWMKPSEKIEIPYAHGLARSRFSIRCAEEEFLDQYYAPKLGMALNRLSDDE